MSEPIKPKYKRSIKNILINPKYQLKYMFWLSLTGVALVTMNAATFYHYVKENYSILVDMSPMTDEAKRELYNELHLILIKLVSGSFVFLLMVGVLGIILSHRTAGPLFQFSKVFKKIKEGHTDTRIHLRTDDDFQEVAIEFNSMMDSLVKKNNEKTN